MKKLLSFLLLSIGLVVLPARAHLDGILPLAADDITAIKQLKASPAKHVLVYFGDHAN